MSERSSPTLPLLIIVLLLAASVTASRWARKPTMSLPAPLPSVMVGGWLNTDAPIEADDLAGNWVVLDCWGTWCGPCIQAMPELAELNRRWRDRGVVVIGIAGDDKAKKARIGEIISAVPGFDWPVAYGGQEVFAALGIQSIPSVFLYDPQGNKVWDGHRLGELEAVLQQSVGSEL